MGKKEKRRANDRNIHYTYLITDHINNKYYYGVHSTDHDPEDINNYASSSKKLKLLINTLGINNFSKKVRKIFSTREEASNWEHKVLRRLKRLPCWDDFYNICTGGNNFSAEGYCVVKVIGEENSFLKVPIGDPYIGHIYDYQNRGVPLSDENKKALSKLYKGKKWVGKDNPVHQLKDDINWRLKLSKGSESKKIDTEKHKNSARANLAKGSPVEICPEVKERMHKLRSINNNRRSYIFIYKGTLYFKNPSSRIKKGMVRIKVSYPLIDVMMCEGNRYPSIKHAAEDLNITASTVRNRLTYEYREDYYYFKLEDIEKDKDETYKQFKVELETKYQDIIDSQLKGEDK